MVRIAYKNVVEVDKIKAWLKRIEKNRAWLGEQLCVSKSTVDGWLSSGYRIPLLKQAKIAALMEAEAGHTQELEFLRALEDKTFHIATCVLPASVYKTIEAAAARENIGVSTYIRKVVIDRVVHETET